MEKEAIPLQFDMFKGTLVDSRSSYHKKRDRERELPPQLSMFSAQEHQELSAHARPWLDDAPKGLLTLDTQDIRTPEEVETDLLRQAQSLTASLFPEPPASSPHNAVSVQPEVKSDVLLTSIEPVVSEESPMTEENEEDEPSLTDSKPEPVSKLAAYKELVTLAEEKAATLYAAPTVTLSETIRMSVAKSEAKHTGLTEYEIALALEIGEFRGQSMVKVAQTEKPAVPDVLRKGIDIPILWMNRDDMLKRRPDLATVINALRDDELEDLGGIIGQALEEFYWIQLNVVLSLYIDHDLRLFRTIQKAKQENKQSQV